MVTGKSRELLFKVQVFICTHAPRLKASGACKLNLRCVVTSVCVSYDRVVSTRDTIPDSGYEIRRPGQKKLELKLRLDSLHFTLFTIEFSPSFKILNLIFSKVIVVQ